MKFLEELKKELRPDNSILTEIESFVSGINLAIKKAGLKAACVPGGSVAKSTFLKGDFDVDLFVKFDYSCKGKNISDMLETVLKKYGAERVHGSRDYFQLKNDSLNYEIVPVLDVKKPELAENVTDMSPMHVLWVKKRLKEGQDDEIRLAKKFCKAARCYGAESYISGFSGHVIDIMVINYGSLISLLKASQKWKAPVIIDTEKCYRSSQEILFNMNQSKIKGPMIIVDPLLKTRNAASALSYEKFTIFRKKASAFLKKPSGKFFIEENIGITELRKKYRKNLVILALGAANGKRDVVGSKIVKAFKFMKQELKKAGFAIKNSGWEWNEKKRALFWFVFKDMILPKEKIIAGPPIEMKEHVRKFREEHRKSFEKKGKMFAEVKIEKRKVEDNLMEIAEKEYFTERLKLMKLA